MQSGYLGYQDQQQQSPATTSVEAVQTEYEQFLQLIYTDYYLSTEHNEHRIAQELPPASNPLLRSDIFADPTLVVPSYIYPLPYQMATYEADSYPADQLLHNPGLAQPTVHIHSPIPVPAYSTLFAHTSVDSSSPFPQYRPLQSLSAVDTTTLSVHYPSPISENPPTLIVSQENNPSGEGLGNTFDVSQVALRGLSSELLNDTVQDQAGAGVVPCACFYTPHPPPTTGNVSASLCSMQPECKVPQPKVKVKGKAKVLAALQPVDPGKTESLRKSYFRLVAGNVGFQPTDP